MTIEAGVRAREEKTDPLERVIRLFAARHPPLIREEDEAIKKRHWICKAAAQPRGRSTVSNQPSPQEEADPKAPFSRLDIRPC